MRTRRGSGGFAGDRGSAEGRVRDVTGGAGIPFQLELVAA